MLIHNADITGSLTINGVPYTTGSFSGSFIAGTNIMSANTVSLTGSFTGSFFGDGSQLSGVTSYTDADTLSFIQGYSGSFSGSFFGDGSNLSGVTSYTDADTLDFINSLNVVSGSIQTVSTVSDTFTSATSYTVTHNFGTKEVIVSVYENDTLIFPSSITTPTTNTVTITFPEPVTGRVVVVKAGHIVSGSINYNSVLNKPTLVSGSSQISFTGITNKPTLVSGSSQITYSGLTGIPSGIVSGSSQITYSGLAGVPSGIVSGSSQVAQFGYATTGSNQFNASQTITGSLTVTGAIVAQTLNVQQVTSSIVFSSGSNRFGNELGNTQQFTGSVGVTGSLTVAGAGAFTGALNGSSAVFSSTVSATQYTATSTGGSGLRVYGAAGTNQWDIYLNSTNLRFSDNTGGGRFVVDSPATLNTTLFSSTSTYQVSIKSTGAQYLLVGSENASGAGIILDGDSNGDGTGGDYSYITHESSGVLNIVQDSPSGTNEIRFGTAGTENKVVINSSGNVGIGITNPTGSPKLQVQAAIPSLFIADSTANSPTYGGSIFYRNHTGVDQGNGISFALNNVSNTQVEYSYIGALIETNTAGNLQNGSIIFAPTSGGNREMRMSITSNGYVRLTTGGIQFNGDTAAANALDDYEEGTWTPVVKIGTTTNTGTGRGKYTKIGNVVYIQATITSITKSGTGGLTVEGLPFTVGTSGTFGDIQGTLRWGSITSSGVIYPYFESSSNRIIMQDFSSAGYVNTIQGSQISSTYELYGISGFYMV